LVGTLQFIWWGGDYFAFRRLGPWPTDGINRGAVYRWRVLFGPLEVRRFNAAQPEPRP
jgi:hypothetical protein